MSGKAVHKDYYRVLGISNNASAREIASAYRSLALKYHPDKNLALESVERFHDVTRAYQVLTDVDARKALDALLATKEAHRRREAELDASRRELRDDLLQREREARKRKAEEEASQLKLLQEIDRLRREAAAAARQGEEEGEPARVRIFDDLDRTLKVASSMPLTVDYLEQILSPYGELEHILVSNKARGAVVLVKDVAVAKSIMMDAEHGEFAECPVRLTWAKGHAPHINVDLAPSKAELLDERDFESLTLMKMRQRAERAHLRAKLEQEEKTL